MALAHDINKIRALKFKSWCMQVAQLQKQQPEQDPWYNSPINILNMPFSSTQISFRPFDLFDLTGTCPITKFHMDVIRHCPWSRWLTDSEPFFPNDLKADQKAKYLGLQNAPSRWQGGNDGWILWTRYTPIPTYYHLPWTNIKKVSKEHLPVTIRTLPFQDQYTAYRQLHKTATPAQLVAYYTLHIAQLDLARCYVARGKLKRLKEPNQISPTCLFHRHDQPSKRTQLAHLSPALQKHFDAQRALFTNAEDRLEKQYKSRAVNRAQVRGWERLVEECEVLLRRKGAKFPTVDWRPFTSRKRWQDGKRGWTGLSGEEVRGDGVEGPGRDVRSDKVSWADVKKVTRAKFAREFPRGVDRRICAATTRGEGLAAVGVKERKEKAAKEMGNDGAMMKHWWSNFALRMSSGLGFSFLWPKRDEIEGMLNTLVTSVLRYSG